MRVLLTYIFMIVGILIFGFGTFLGGLRQQESSLYFLLTRQSSDQFDGYRYELHSPNNNYQRVIEDGDNNRFWFVKWSTDQNIIWYQVNGDTSNEGIYTLNLNTNERQQIIDTSLDFANVEINEAPDQQQFLLSINLGFSISNVILINNVTFETEPLFEPNTFASDFVWGDNSQYFYFLRFDENVLENYRYDIATKEIEVVEWYQRIRVTEPNGNRYIVSDSEDLLAWQLTDPASNTTIQLDTSSYPDLEFRIVGWFPNEKIIFQAYAVEDVFLRQTPDLYLTDASLSELRPLFEGAEASDIADPIPFTLDNYVFIPALNDQEEITLYRVDVLSEETIPLIPNLRPIRTPTAGLTSPDSRQPEIIFWHEASRQFVWREYQDQIGLKLLRTHIDTGETHLVYEQSTSLRDFTLHVAPNNEWLYINIFSTQRNGSDWNLIRANLSTDQVETLSNGTELLAISPLRDTPYNIHQYAYGGGAILLIALALIRISLLD